MTGLRRARVLLAIAEPALRLQVRRRIEEGVPADFLEAANGLDALSAIQRELPDMLVATVDLPGQLDGLALCHRVRGLAGAADVPVMVLGPRGDQRRKYQAFYVGASDYMELPLDGTELGLRSRVHLRGVLRSAPDRLEAGPLCLDLASRTARLAGREAVLTPSELDVLVALVQAAGRPVPVERLLEAALRRPVSLGGPQLIHTHIRNLRKKLEGNPSAPEWLLRHPAGYVLRLEA
ncbi:MAG: response regulator transcription factor [Candidatus Sericytochromatia bacterium]|nr:response regulator transcription factor [Candidatus Sericytochromatia bacterium]